MGALLVGLITVELFKRYIGIHQTTGDLLGQSLGGRWKKRNLKQKEDNPG